MRNLRAERRFSEAVDQYDDLLMEHGDRASARAEVAGQVDARLEEWRTGG
jgi:hypothetical protein